MKLTKLSPATQAILNKLPERQSQLHSLMHKFTELDPSETQAVAKLQNEVKALLKSAA